MDMELEQRVRALEEGHRLLRQSNNALKAKVTELEKRIAAIEEAAEWETTKRRWAAEEGR